jgi:transposase InsO family protein
MSTTVKNSKMARRYGEEFKRQAVELLLHSGKTQRQVARELDVRKPLEVIQAIPSMSGVGNCYDNAKAEAFFSTLKTECFPLSNCFTSKAQARSTIFEYIEVYYNNQRLHSALGYQSLRQYESRYQQEKRTTFSKEKVTAILCAEGRAKVKPANGINGGKPVGRRRLCRIATLTVA